MASVTAHIPVSHSSSIVPSTSSLPPGTRLLTDEEFSKMKAIAVPACTKAFKEAMRPIITDLIHLNVAGEHAVQAKQHREESKRHSENAARHGENAARHGENAERLRAEANLHKARADKLKEEAALHKAEGERLGRIGLIKSFYRIFNKVDPLIEKYDEIFNTYLADHSLTVEKSTAGKSIPIINNMTSVIKYLRSSPTTTAGDFRHFNDQVNDIATLAEFLKTSSIKGVAFRNTISDLAKSQLAAAAATRPSTAPLKVQYFA